MTTQSTHENVIKIAGVLGVMPDLRITANGNTVATLIIYTNYTMRNADGSTRQESERHRVIVWGMHAEKAARLLKKGSKVRVQGRMTEPTW
jgi:single-strand DNA-binding protein